MNSEKNIVKVLKNSLGFTNVQNLGDLGEMRQNTIETKIQKHRKKLTDINVASIYNAWLREQNCRLDKTKSDVVKAYCRFLESFRCQPPWIATMWDECTRGALKDAVNTDETERIERHMLKIRGEIEKYFGKSLFTGKGEWLPSAGTCLPVVASTTERTDKENPNPNTSSAPLQSSKVVSSFQKSHLTWMKAAQTNLGPRVSQTAPQPSLELKQRDQVVIDLAQDSWETSTPQPFALQHADELDETMPPPPSYVCHRCNCRGHYISACPTNSDPSFDPKPGFGYTCHICGGDDHFITSCPKKTPGCWIKKKTASFQPLKDDDGLRRGPPPPSWTTTGFKSPDQARQPEGAGYAARIVSGHIRKRSDNVEYLDQILKKPKTDPEINTSMVSPVQHSTWIPVLRDQSPLRSEGREGRLTPWTDESEGHLNTRQGTGIQESRGDRVAQLEAKSFLAEMSQELGERATQERCEARTLSALLHLFQTPRPQRKKRGGEDEDVLAEDPEDLCPRSLGSAAPTGHDDAAPLWVDDDCLSPMTPGPPPKIEFFVTPKPLYQNPLYHPGVVSLFHHRTNPWVQQVRRPSSLDLWEVPGDEAAGEVPQELEAEVPQDAETGKDGAGDDIVEVIVIEDDETTGEAVQDTEVEMGGTAGGVAEVTLIEDETTGDGQQRPESNETTGQGPLCPENDEITNTVPQRPESDETTNRGRQCPEVREDGITCQTTERPEAKTGGPNSSYEQAPSDVDVSSGSS